MSGNPEHAAALAEGRIVLVGHQLEVGGDDLVLGIPRRLHQPSFR